MSGIHPEGFSCQTGIHTSIWWTPVHFWLKLWMRAEKCFLVFILYSRNGLRRLRKTHYSDQQLDLLRHLHFSTCEIRDLVKRITLSPSSSKILKLFFYAVSEIAISAGMLGFAYFFTDFWCGSTPCSWCPVLRTPQWPESSYTQSINCSDTYPRLMSRYRFLISQM